MTLLNVVKKYEKRINNNYIKNNKNFYANILFSFFSFDMYLICILLIFL